MVALARALRHFFRALVRFLFILPVLLCLVVRVSAGEPGGQVLVAPDRMLRTLHP